MARNYAQLPGVSVVKGDYGDLSSLEAAAEGADRAYVACNNVGDQSRFERNFIDACKVKGVRRIAKVSMFRYFCREDGPGHGAAHYEIEQHLHNSGLDHVILHNSCYFQTLFFFAPVIKTAGILPWMLGDMKPNMVDCRDVAEYTAALLTCDDNTFAPFNGRHVEIAGPEAIGGEGLAEALRRVGVDVRYEKLSPDEFRQGLLGVGIPEDMANNVTAIHTCYYDRSAQISDHATTPELLGLPGSPKSPRRLEAFAREVAPIFRASP